jgi:hypothetical protein
VHYVFSEQERMKAFAQSFPQLKTVTRTFLRNDGTRPQIFMHNRILL